MDGNKDVAPMIDQELEFKKLLFQIAKQLNSTNVKDLIHFFDEIPKGERPGIKNGLQLMEVLLRLDQVSYQHTGTLKRNLDRIGKKKLVGKLVDLEEELDSRIKTSMHQDEEPKTEDASQLIENDGSSVAMESSLLNMKEGEDVNDGNDKEVDNDKDKTKIDEDDINKEEKSWDDDSSDSSDSDDEKVKKEVYPMNANPCGKCLIINNNFEGASNVEPRVGSDVDAKNLSEVFESLNFEVEVLKNLKQDILMNTLTNEMMDKNKQDHNAFVLCILTYGKGDTLYSFDGNECKVQDVIDMFANKNCEYLKGKPKFFFIQSCHAPCNTGNKMQYKNINQAEDQIVWFGSSPDSLRSPNSGTWFIKIACKLLKKHASKKKFYDINLMLSREIEKKRNSTDGEFIFKTFGESNLRGPIQFCTK